ncbi:hypothetical protein K493DRAFT_406598, partial [Basidiobolus meristosporus CBS 931.73]
MRDDRPWPGGASGIRPDLWYGGATERATTFLPGLHPVETVIRRKSGLGRHLRDGLFIGYPSLLGDCKYKPHSFTDDVSLILPHDHVCVHVCDDEMSSLNTP